MTEEKTKQKSLTKNKTDSAHIISTQIINKGTGAGGKNTTLNGKKYEDQTDIESYLISKKFDKKIMDKKSPTGYYLYKEIDNKKLYFTKQSGLKILMKKIFDIDIFRKPDEAFIIDDNSKIIIKILEKKVQNTEGSVETKLWAGVALKREYEIVCEEKYTINYAYSLSTFLSNKMKSSDNKYIVLKQILNEYNIKYFYGDDDNYINKIYDWFINDSEEIDEYNELYLFIKEYRKVKKNMSLKNFAKIYSDS